MKKLRFLLAAIIVTLSTVAHSSENLRGNMRIRIIAGENIVVATLNASKAAQDFRALLPLTLTLGDYGQNEKVSNLPKKLSIDGSPAGYTPKKGDLAHYAPWGNFIVFRQNSSYSSNLIKLGEINEGLSALDHSGPIQITIEMINQ